MSNLLSIKDRLEMIDQIKLPNNLSIELNVILKETNNFEDEVATDAFKGNFDELFLKIKDKHPECLKRVKIKKDKVTIVKHKPLYSQLNTDDNVED